MAEAAKAPNYWMVGTRVMAVALFASALYIVFQPKIAEKPHHFFLGDGLTGCAYPFETLDMKTLKRYTEEGDVIHWDEIDGLENVKKFGYRFCP